MFVTRITNPFFSCLLSDLRRTLRSLDHLVPKHCYRFTTSNRLGSQIRESKEMIFPPRDYVMKYLENYPFQGEEFYQKNSSALNEIANHFAGNRIINQNQIERDIYSILSSRDCCFYRHSMSSLVYISQIYAAPFVQLFKETGCQDK